MDAISHIQVATGTTVMPKVSMSEAQGTGTNVFREAMRQALEPERNPAKGPERAAPASPPPTHTASSSSRTAQHVVPKTSETNSANADSGAVEQGTVSTRVVTANVNVFDSSTSAPGSTQIIGNRTTAKDVVSGKSSEVAVSESTTEDGSTASAQSSAPTSKDMRVTGKNTQKASSDGGSAEPATTSPTASTAGVMALPLMLPAAKSRFGASTSQGATTMEASVTDGEYLHGLSRTQETTPSVLVKQSESATLKSELPSTPLVPAGAPHGASVASANSVEGPVGFDTTPADLETTTSSSDLLLNTRDSAQASPGSGDSNGAPSSAAAVNDSSAGTVTSGSVVSRASDLPVDIQGVASGTNIASVSATFRGGTTGQAAASAAVQPPAPIGGQAVSAIGNISGAHPGTSAALSIGPSGARNTQPSMTPSATFAAMDRADSSPSGVLLHASSNQVAVGVSDPGLGWIEVRAERVAGQMTAALTTSSAVSHAELTSVLPAMSSYLNDHHQSVQHIQIEAGLTSGQNSTGSQEQSGKQHRQTTTAEPLGAISGIGDRLKISATQQASSAAEIVPQKTKLDGHQFSVRA